MNFLQKSIVCSQRSILQVRHFSCCSVLNQDRSLNDISNKIIEKEVKNQEHYHPTSLKSFHNRKVGSSRHLDDESYLHGTDSFSGLTLNGDREDEHYFDVHDKLSHDEKKAATAAKRGSKPHQ